MQKQRNAFRANNHAVKNAQSLFMIAALTEIYRYAQLIIFSCFHSKNCHSNPLPIFDALTSLISKCAAVVFGVLRS